MKKLLRIGSLILALAMLFSVSVLAAGKQDPGICDVVVNDGDVTATPRDASWAEVAPTDGGTEVGTYYPNAVQFSVTLDNQSNGAFRFLRVQDVPGAFQEQNLVYIDQATVTGGKAVFDHVYPSELKKGTTYYVYVTGNDGYEETLIMTFGYYQSYTLGDVDDNDAVNATDALWILQNAAGTRAFDATQTSAGDVDHNDAVNATDALWVLQNAAGTRTLS